MLFTEFNMEDALEVRGEEKFAEGLAAGKAESLLELLGAFGEVPEALREKIFAVKDLDLLERWFKLALKAKSIGTFERMIR